MEENTTAGAASASHRPDDPPVYDLVVIGSGPGGYVAAIKAAQLGMKVACVEKDRTLGGTCLNVGCIPSKALLESSELYEESRHKYANHGIKISGVELDLPVMLARKDKVVHSLVTGVAGLFKKYGVQWVKGHGRIIDAGTVEAKPAEGEAVILKTARILIATGSSVASPRFIPLDGDRVITSSEALSLPEVPKHLIVIGAGVIGVELGSVWNRLGAKVTLIELLPRILNGIDGEVAATAQKLLTRQGLQFVLGARVTRVERQGDEVEVVYEPAGEAAGPPVTLKGDRVLVCVGRRPNTEGLGAQEAGIQLDRAGRIDVDPHFQTNIPGIYAIGDVIRGAMLAHKAEEEGVAAVELMNGIAGHVNYDAIPNVVYTWPEIASVGRTEEELKEAGIDYKKGSFPFSANGRAKAMGHTDGMTKILADAKTDRILGAHIVGPRAGDLIAELAIAVEFGGSSEDIARSSHAHPTLAETIKEAALAVTGKPLNF